MSVRSRTSAAVLVAVALAAGAVSLRAEGFWLFNAVPKGAIKQAYGFDVTDAWLQHVRLASVRFGGASGSFISPDGLVLTNHHVGLSTIAKLSTPERDLVKQGFYARTQADELKAPDLELTVLQSIEDVTERVNAAVTAGMSQAEAFAARRAAITTIEQESMGHIDSKRGLWCRARAVRTQRSGRSGGSHIRHLEYPPRSVSP